MHISLCICLRLSLSVHLTLALSRSIYLPNTFDILPLEYALWGDNAMNIEAVCRVDPVRGQAIMNVKAEDVQAVSEGKVFIQRLCCRQIYIYQQTCISHPCCSRLAVLFYVVQCQTLSEYRDAEAKKFLDQWATALHFIDSAIPSELKSLLRKHVPDQTPFNHKALSDAVMLQTALNPALVAGAFQLDAGM